jgi:hypothetical protein
MNTITLAATAAFVLRDRAPLGARSSGDLCPKVT